MCENTSTADTHTYHNMRDMYEEQWGYINGHEYILTI